MMIEETYETEEEREARIAARIAAARAERDEAGGRLKTAMKRKAHCARQVKRHTSGEMPVVRRESGPHRALGDP